MPEHTTPSVLVFMSGRNCATYVEHAIRSVSRQTHELVHVLLVDDCSDDDTWEKAEAALMREMPGRYTLIRNPRQMGKAYNASVHLRPLAAQHDIVAVLDADDALIDLTVFAQLAAAYRDGADVVWTNFITDQGRFGCSGPLDPGKSPRLQRWLTSHLFSFRASLMANVPEHYFQYPDGRWLDAACDFALAYPMLDQTRRYRFIPIHAYRYTESNPESHHNQAQERQSLSSPKQRQCAQVVLSHPPLPRLDQKEAPPAAPGHTGQRHDLATAWETACAVQLLQTLPTLLDHIDVTQLQEVDAMLLTEWHQRLHRIPEPKVLIGGSGKQAAALHCLVTQLGGHVTHWQAHAADQTSAAEQSAHIVSTPWAEYVLGNDTAYLPEIGAIEHLAPFDMVVLETDAWGGRCLPLVGLAALGPLLRAEAFLFYVLGKHMETLREAKLAVEEAMPGLTIELQGRRNPWLRVGS